MAVREARLGPSCTRPSPAPRRSLALSPFCATRYPPSQGCASHAPSQILSPFSPSRRPAFLSPLPRLGFSSILIPVSLSCASPTLRVFFRL